MPQNEMAASLRRDGFSPDEIAAMCSPTASVADAPDPTPLRWGLNDVMWGDDDSVTVLLSGPGGEPYWLELDAERATVLRADLAGPLVPVSSPPADQAALRDRIAAALYDHSHPGWAISFPDLDQDQRDTYLARADAVLAVLPATTTNDVAARTLASLEKVTDRARRAEAEVKRLRTMYDASEARVNDLIDERDQLLETRTDRAAVLREAADEIAGIDFHPNARARSLDIAAGLARRLRRMADETAATETPWPIVTDFSIEVWEGDTWVGVTYKRKTIEEARERRDSFRRRFPEERLRIVRWDETPTVVEADPEPPTKQPFVPPAHYRRDDDVDCCVHAIPVGPNSCAACRELADAEPAAGARQDGAQR